MSIKYITNSIEETKILGEKLAQILKKGDVVNIPAETKHWHGAAPNSWFSHLAFEIEGENTSNEWLEEVSDEQYNKLK